MRLIIIFLIVICYSCSLKHSISLNIINENIDFDTTKIRYNGFYNTLDTIKYLYEGKYKGKTPNEIYSSYDMIIFSKKKNIFIDEGGSTDNKHLTCEFFNTKFDWYNSKYNVDKINPLGIYTIKNDSVYAYSQTTITTWGMIPRVKNCNFRGFIKNKDTITDWKIVAPYPKGVDKFILEHNKTLFEPKILYFVKTDAVKCLKMDSVKK